MNLPLKNLSRRKSRTALSIVGIAVGVGAFIALVAFSSGLEEQITAIAKASEGDLIVQLKGTADTILSFIKEEDVRRIGQIEGVESTSSLLIHAHAVPKDPVFVLYGYNPEEKAIKNFKIIPGGKPLGPNSRDKIVLGRRATKNLQVGIGDHIKIRGKRLKVIGVYTSEVPLLDVAGLVHLKTCQEISGRKGQVNCCAVNVKPGYSKEEIKEKIEEMLPEHEAILAEDFGKSYSEQLELVENFTWAISLIALIVSMVGVLNTMMMSVSERMREIGTLRALGWNKRMILRLILVEGLIISVIGGIFGIVFGIIGGEIVINLRHMGWLKGNYSIALFAEGMAIAVGVGFLGALYPAYRATKLSPIEALRYE